MIWMLHAQKSTIRGRLHYSSAGHVRMDIKTVCVNSSKYVGLSVIQSFKSGSQQARAAIPLGKFGMWADFPAGKMTLKIRCFNVRYHVVAMSETSWI